jgi:UDP-N-acetylglucosamine 1-carboxyvinyltransferase
MIEDAWSVAGGRPLLGRVRLSGSKNGALPTLAATLLVEGETVLHDVPRIADVSTMLELLRAFGVAAEEDADGAVRVINRGISTHSAPAHLARRMRASHYLLGPLLARVGRAELPLTGGCRIGERPLDHVVSALEPLGAKVDPNSEATVVSAAKLTGATISLNPVYRSPGATFTSLMASALAEGTTVIENASYEPDVVTFCHFLRAAGAQIEGTGTPVLTITGVDRLRGTSHRINADRLEAGTFLCAAAATRGDIAVEGVRREELASVVDKLEEAGVAISVSGNALRACCRSRPRAVSLTTEPFPGFPTDLQPVLTAFLACAEGESMIRECIFDNRLQYAEQLRRMGASVRLIDSGRAIVTGVDHLDGASVEAHNIRDGAAMVIAALSARGESRVLGRSFIARGYEDFDVKLRSLGAEMGGAEGHSVGQADQRPPEG